MSPSANRFVCDNATNGSCDQEAVAMQALPFAVQQGISLLLHGQLQTANLDEVVTRTAVTAGQARGS